MTTTAEIVKADLFEWRAPRTTTRLLVGITGSPGSGKSTVAADLALSTSSPGWPFGLGVVVPMDGFHLSQAELTELGRRDRMGAPDTFDVDAFVDALEAIRRDDQSVWFPTFDRVREEPVADGVLVSPDLRVVIVEGNYLLYAEQGWGRVAGLLDRTYFLAPDEKSRRTRLINRHIAFGKSLSEAEASVTNSDDAIASLIAGTATSADRILRS